jgi:hypothetical protein
MSYCRATERNEFFPAPNRANNHRKFCVAFLLLLPPVERLCPESETSFEHSSKNSPSGYLTATDGEILAFSDNLQRLHG